MLTLEAAWRELERTVQAQLLSRLTTAGYTNFETGAFDELPPSDGYYAHFTGPTKRRIWLSLIGRGVDPLTSLRVFRLKVEIGERSINQPTGDWRYEWYFSSAEEVSQIVTELVSALSKQGDIPDE